MSYKPILFNTEMVKAIQDGRKTQTRRLVKEIPLHAPYFEICDGKPYACDMYGEWHPAERFCRIQPGDILWVRETWRPTEASSAGWCRIEYKAGGTEYFKKVIAVLKYQEPWHPSIHMPKEAARLFLRVKDVRMEHLGDMRLHDCLNEGVRLSAAVENDLVRAPIRAREWFSQVWDSTIKPADRDVYGWDANPWVWVIEFERCEKPVDWR